MKEKWKYIISDIVSNPRDISTIPNDSSTPVWFYAYSDGKNVYIEQAKNNTPSSELSKTMVLRYSMFKKVFPIFLRRENGEDVTSEARNSIQGPSYWYPICNIVKTAV